MSICPAPLAPNIADGDGAAGARAVCFIRERVDTACIHPAVVEIEERADRDGIVDRVILPTVGSQGLHIGFRDGRRFVVHAIHKTEKRAFLLLEGTGLDAGENRPDECFAIVERALLGEQQRRDRGVRLRSKRTVVLCGGIGGDQLAEAGCEWAGFPHDLLGELGQVMGRSREEGEEAPDLGILLAAGVHNLYRVGVWGRFGIVLNPGKKHRFHGAVRIPPACYDRSRAAHPGQ